MNLPRDLASAPESLFWYFITARHEVYLKKTAGQPKPWTDDPILQRYKFTNVFRELDRGTIWLRENFLKPHRDDTLELIAFNICWYRLFNWEGTGQLLGWQTIWDPEAVKTKLNTTRLLGRQVFTGAHIVYSTPGRGKIEAIVDVCTELWKLRCDIRDRARMTRRLEETFHLLTTVYCVGSFLAYEMVTDMRHTRLLEDSTDIMTWANVGPGAARGLRRLDLPETLASMRWLLAQSRQNLPDWIPALELRDVEHSLCEFDKYARVKFGEGQPRSKYPGIV